MNWKCDLGFFERTEAMIFALEPKVIGKKARRIPIYVEQIIEDSKTFSNERLFYILVIVSKEDMIRRRHRRL